MTICYDRRAEKRRKNVLSHTKPSLTQKNMKKIKPFMKNNKNKKQSAWRRRKKKKGLRRRRRKEEKEEKKGKKSTTKTNLDGANILFCMKNNKQEENKI